MSNQFFDKLSSIIEHFQVLEKRLMEVESLSREDYIKYSKEHAELIPLVESINTLQKKSRDFKELEEILADSNQDIELQNLAKKELIDAKHELEELELMVKKSLLPKDEADEKNAIMEIRAGTGGEEAALFAAVLLRMYNYYATNQGWKFEIMEASPTSIGGYKDITALITGKGVFSKLKFESGVHRVQRVPETESSGRIHTSAATVAVLPEAEDVDVEIDDKDLRIDVFRSSGPGGQSVNTTDSAVRITHIPTGVVVQQQDEKSQHKNKAKALKILRSRLYEMKRMEQEAKRAADRKGQIGSGDRSERIRTYNFPQGRVTDHRINLTLYNLDAVVNEGKLDEIINSLITQDEAERLANSLE